MVSELLMGFDESTLAYDLQRAHSADVWFLRARFFIWGTAASVVSFAIGHALPFYGVNIYGSIWGGLTNFWNHLW
tara:strand:- start:5810 stop:6034 length:225 start_codon:yes stop_codon:yes gene_type:complete